MKDQKMHWVIGNWKMNPLTPEAAKDLAVSLQKDFQPFLQNTKTQIAFAPSMLHLGLIQQHCSLTLCAQDVSGFAGEVGAATGDVSAAQLQAMGVTMTLIGHSERRDALQESHDLLYKKVQQAANTGLLVVFCVGESKQEYESGQTLAVLNEQLAALRGFGYDKLMIAYEPVWAIGTGLTPTLTEIETVHRYIKDLLGDVPVLYGGSVNETNAQNLAQSPWIDGALVGGASLVPEKFLAVVAAFDGI